MLRSARIIIVALLIGTIPSMAELRTEAQRPLALLVGVSEYDYPGLTLNGPPNDVAAFHQMLTDREGPFRFDENRVIRLFEARDSAAEFDQEQLDLVALPTARNVRAAMHAVAARAQAGEVSRLIVLLSGHGYRQPSSKGGAVDPEEDGLDEVFLLRDCNPVFDPQDRLVNIENAILDNELRQWLETIADAGVAAWVVLDMCHAGTGTRGSGQVRSPDWLVQGAAPMSGMSGFAPPLKGVVSFFAAQASESAFESRYPKTAPDRPESYMGDFSYHLVQALSKSKGRLSYQDLLAQIRGAYRENGIRAVPGAEFGDLAEVRISDLMSARNLFRFRLSCEPDCYLDAGAIQGVTVGSKIAIYLPGSEWGENLAPEATALVEEVTPLGARVLIEGEWRPARGLRYPCRLVALRVACPVRLALDLGPDEQKLIIGELQKKGTNLSRCAVLAATSADADAVLSRRADRTYTLEVRGTCDAVALGPTKVYDLESRDALAVVGPSIQRLYAWWNLERVVDALPPATELLSFTTDVRSESGAISTRTDLRTVKMGESIAWKGRNIHGGDLFVAAIYLAEDFEIIPLGVQGGGLGAAQRVEPGHEFYLHHNNARWLRTKRSTWQPERLIVLAMPCGDRLSEPDFEVLRQTGLPAVTPRPVPRSRRGDNLLSDLLAELAGGTRSDTPPVGFEDVSALILTFDVVK